jgi:hypothetical protein
MRKHIAILFIWMSLINIITVLAQENLTASQFWPLKDETNRWVYYFPSNSVNILFPKPGWDTSSVYIDLVPYYESSSLNPFHINLPPMYGKPLIYIEDYKFDIILSFQGRTIANFAVAVGDSFYTYDPIDLYVKCISRDTTVTVRAGTFEYCMAFDNGAIWAPGIGPVNELEMCRVNGKEYFPTIVHESATSFSLDSPNMVELMPNFPNPFNSQTAIQFKTTVSAYLKIYITDVLGRHIRDLANAQFPAGQHRIIWDGTDDRGRSAPSGIYLIHLQGESRHKTVKCLLTR